MINQVNFNLFDNGFCYTYANSMEVVLLNIRISRNTKTTILEMGDSNFEVNETNNGFHFVVLDFLNTKANSRARRIHFIYQNKPETYFNTLEKYLKKKGIFKGFFASRYTDRKTLNFLNQETIIRDIDYANTAYFNPIDWKNRVEISKQTSLLRHDKLLEIEEPLEADNNYDETDWTHYNDNLDMDQQPSEFWDQF